MNTIQQQALKESLDMAHHSIFEDSRKARMAGLRIRTYKVRLPKVCQVPPGGRVAIFQPPWGDQPIDVVAK